FSGSTIIPQVVIRRSAACCCYINRTIIAASGGYIVHDPGHAEHLRLGNRASERGGAVTLIGGSNCIGSGSKSGAILCGCSIIPYIRHCTLIAADRYIYAAV